MDGGARSFIGGDYLEPTRVGPFPTADEALLEAYKAASEYIVTLAAMVALR